MLALGHQSIEVAAFLNASASFHRWLYETVAFHHCGHLSNPAGTAIGGTNIAFDGLTNSEIAATIRPRIEIAKEGSLRAYEIRDVDANVSLIGQKNMFLLIAGDGVDETAIGARVSKGG